MWFCLSLLAHRVVLFRTASGMLMIPLCLWLRQKDVRSKLQTPSSIHQKVRYLWYAGRASDLYFYKGLPGNAKDPLVCETRSIFLSMASKALGWYSLQLTFPLSSRSLNIPLVPFLPSHPVRSLVAPLKWHVLHNSMLLSVLYPEPTRLLRRHLFGEFNILYGPI